MFRFLDLTRINYFPTRKLLVHSYRYLTLPKQTSTSPTVPTSPPISQVFTQEKSSTISDQERIQAIISGGRRFIEDAIQSKPDLTHFLAAMTVELAKNPDLLRCSQESLYRAMFACIQLGLQPGPLAHCYFAPRGTKVEFHIGYRGLVLLASNSKAISSVAAFCVYENDEFQYTAGTSPKIVHTPTLKNRGQLSYVYAVIELPKGSKIFQVMTKEDVEKHQACSAAKHTGPWKTWPEEMWKKTAIRKALKLIPISLQSQLERDTGSLLYQDTIPTYEEGNNFLSIPEESLPQGISPAR